MTKRTCCYCNRTDGRLIAVGYDLKNWPADPPMTLYACPECYQARGIPHRPEKAHRGGMETLPNPLSVSYAQPTLF